MCALSAAAAAVSCCSASPRLVKTIMQCAAPLEELRTCRPAVEEELLPQVLRSSSSPADRRTHAVAAAPHHYR